jgi:Uma2 family endonuclease
MSDTAANLDDTSKRILQPSTIWDNLPESKLEVIDGRLIVGNGLMGSRYLLWAIVQTLGPQAALPLAPRELWWSTLAAAFQAPAMLSSAQAWERWAAHVEHAPYVAPAGPHFSWNHHETYSQLMLGLHLATREGERIGRSIQRFVMRLGENGYMPDLQCFRRDHLHRLQTYYFDGPADLVIEVTLRGAETQDTVAKRRLYAAGGVPEYCIVDPASRTFEFLRLTADGYEAQPLDADGRYRSTSMPGLSCDPARLWACLDHPEQRRSLDSGIFFIEPEDVNIGSPTTPNDDETWEWEWQPLTLPIGSRPTPISFDQYITWCPEAKFELLDGKPSIGSWEGTRNVLGLLLMTFGLEEAVTLHHPREWVAALLADERNQLNDAGRRDAWWSVARQAAALLRERFGVQRVAVIGDLVRPAPLGFWSEITLVAWGQPKEYYTIYQAFDELAREPRIEVRRAEEASPRQRAAFACEAVDVGGAS